jgi:hypothetical protein
MSDPFSAGRSFDISGLKTFVAMPSHRDIHPLIVMAMLDTQRESIARGSPVSFETKYGNSVAHHARTRSAWSFLQTDCNRLFWIDSDIVWKPADFWRVLALTTEMDIVAGAYTAKTDKPMFMMKASGDMEVNEHGCLPFDGFGLGFCCMTRKVVEALAATAPKKAFHQEGTEPIPHLFFLPGEEADDGQNAVGEDMAFLGRAKAQGFQPYVEPTIELGHIGPKIYSARLMDYLPRVVKAAVSSAA